MNEVEWERPPPPLSIHPPWTLRFHALHLDGGMDGREKSYILHWLTINGVALRSLYLTSLGHYDIEPLNDVLRVGEKSLEEFWCSVELGVFFSPLPRPCPRS